MSAIAAISYVICSVSLTLINKKLLSTPESPHVLLFTLFQVYTTLGLSFTLKKSDIIKMSDSFEGFPPKAILRGHVTTAFFYLAYVLTSLYALQSLNVQMFITLRRTGVMFTFIFDTFWSNKVYSKICVFAVFLITMGSLLASYEEIVYDPKCFLLVFLCNASTAVYLSKVHQTNEKGKLTSHGVLWCNCILSVFPLTVLALYTGDIQVFTKSIVHGNGGSYIYGVMISSAMVFVLNFCAIYNTRQNSALAQSVCANLKDVIIIIYGCNISGINRMPFSIAIGTSISFFGSLIYALNSHNSLKLLLSRTLSSKSQRKRRRMKFISLLLVSTFITKTIGTHWKSIYLFHSSSTGNAQGIVHIKESVPPLSLYITPKSCTRKCSKKEGIGSTCEFTTGKFKKNWNFTNDVEFSNCIAASKILRQDTDTFLRDVYDGQFNRTKKTMNKKRGVLYVARYPNSKIKHQLALVFAAVKTLHGPINSTLPVEVFVDSVHHTLCKDIFRKDALVTCVAFSRLNGKLSEPRKFGWKTLGILECSFDELLFLDTDVLALKDPSFVFETHEFRDHGAVFFPDITGVACNPEEISMWTSGSRSSALWGTFGLEFQEGNWNFMQEQASAYLFVNKSRHWIPLLLSHFLTEHEIMQQFVYGDKDCFRFAWLMLHSPFYFSEYPGLVGNIKLSNTVRNNSINVCYLLHQFSGEILFLHGKKGYRSETPKCGTGKKGNVLGVILPTKSRTKDGICAPGSGMFNFLEARPSFQYQSILPEHEKYERFWEEYFASMKQYLSSK